MWIKKSNIRKMIRLWRYSAKLVEDSKVLVQGKVSGEEERDGKLICEKITSFDDLPAKVWVKFPNLSNYMQKEPVLFDAIFESEGNDKVVIYIEETRQMKQLPANRNIHADGEVLDRLRGLFGEENVRLVH